MQRITMSLPDDLARSLTREARRRSTSVSEVAREAIAAHLRLDEHRALPFAGLGRSGTHDTARRMDEILAQEWPPS